MALFSSNAGATLGKVGVPKLAAPKPPGGATNGTLRLPGGTMVPLQPPKATPIKISGPSSFKTVSGGLQLPTANGASFSNPYQTTPKAPQGSTPAPVGGGAAPAPLDQTAIANIAAYLNKTNSSIAGLGVTQAGDQAKYQSGYNALAQENPIADLKLMAAANAHGGFYGSAYGQQLGNLNQQYAGKESGLYTTLQTQLQALAAKQAELQGSIPAYESQQATAAAQRLSKLASTAPVAPAPPPGLNPTQAVEAASLRKPNPPVLPGGNAGVLQLASQLPAGFQSGTVQGPGGVRIAGAPSGAKPPPARSAPKAKPAAKPPKTSGGGFRLFPG